MKLNQPVASPLLNEVRTVKHGFFTRAQGVSDGIYEGRNCGLGSHDDPQKVRINLDRCADEIGLKSDALVNLKQVHGTHIITLDAHNMPQTRPEADGVVTADKNIGLCIATADCIPLLALDETAGVIGAAHAGWRGAFDGIVANLIKSMVALGAQPHRIKASIGPNLSQANYEVGPEFVDNFVAKERAYQRYFTPSGTAQTPHYDNSAFVRDRMMEAGLSPSNVSQFDICTYAAEDAFFSYRRTTHKKEPDYGRQISIIALI